MYLLERERERIIPKNKINTLQNKNSAFFSNEKIPK